MTKTLLLMRHAKSSWDDPDLDDLDRPLNQRGKEAATLMAPIVVAWRPQWIGCSLAQRTRSTLAPIINGLDGACEVTLSAAFYEGNAAVYLRHLGALGNAINRALIIGHNPVLEELSHMLIGSAEPDALRKLNEKFATGTLVVLQQEIDSWSSLEAHTWRLVDTARPRDFGGIQDER